MIAFLDTAGNIAIQLNSLHVYGTYEDWLLGGPKSNEMDDLQRKWVARAQALCEDWPVHSVTPTPRQDEGFLPDYVCIGFCSASETRDPDMHGSALVLVWYQQTCPVEAINLPTIYDNDWRASAKDFLY